MFDQTTIGIILFFIISSYLGHNLLHRIIRKPAQYYRPESATLNGGVER
jgi:hypothetical protein